ncbi:MAG: acetolactate synthase small subunit [Nitrospinota bacterium]
MHHTISVLVENKFGVLARVSGLFSGRGYNIESLSVAPTLDPTTSRMTIISRGEAPVMEQITKHLNKLIDVIKVIDYTSDQHDHVEREITLVKVNAESSNRAEILRVTEIFRGKIVDVSSKSYMVEVTGTASKINAFLELIRPLGLIEIARSGKVAMSRGKKTLG